jgi:hypothetical protein
MSLFLPAEKWEARAMKPLSPELLNAYTKALGPLAATPAERGQSQKWLRYYLDFCMKYRHPPRDPDSLEPFLQKLASINQPVAYQEQAARCVSVYYEAVKNWDAVHAGPPAPLSTSSLRLSILSYSSRKNAACSRAKTASLGNVSSFSTRAPFLFGSSSLTDRTSRFMSRELYAPREQ